MTFTDIIKGPSMNPVLMLCRNSLELTKKAIDSVLDQDINTTLYIIDNDSTDGTREYLTQFHQAMRVRNWRMTPAKGVSASWNFGLHYLFGTAMCEHVLVINNDVELRPDTYSALLNDGGDFVTAVSVGDPKQLEWDGKSRIRMHPDFSCYLIRRKVWETVGSFDESMVIYASDGDMHLRMHQAGIEAYTMGIPFYHYASGTMKTATEEERQHIQQQANADRAAFVKKWGVSIGTSEYYDLFGSRQP